jgi:hypothetical protein
LNRGNEDQADIWLWRLFDALSDAKKELIYDEVIEEEIAKQTVSRAENQAAATAADTEQGDYIGLLISKRRT